MNGPTAEPTERGEIRKPSRPLVRALLIFTLALAVYFVTLAAFGRFSTPGYARFDELAGAFLRGELFLRDPADTFDLTEHDGRWYVPFPPLPAVLMLPIVAAAGGVNTVLFSLVVGALNVALGYLLIESLNRRRLVQLGEGDQLWLTAFLALGSAHWYVALDGAVWFLGQTCALTFLLAATWSAARRAPAFATGALLAFALWARPNTVFTWPLLAALAWTEEPAATRPPGRPPTRWVRWTALSLLPLMLSVAGYAAYNAARFGNPLDFGYATQNVSGRLAADLYSNGQFHWRYVPRNAYFMLAAPPVWDALRYRLRPDADGTGLIWTAPVLLFLARAARTGRLARGAWLSLLLMLIPLLFYYNTGWQQFGYRFSLDLMPAVLVLLASAASPKMPRSMRALIVLGIAVHLWGILWWFGGGV